MLHFLPLKHPINRFHCILNIAFPQYILIYYHYVLVTLCMDVCIMINTAPPKTQARRDQLICVFRTVKTFQFIYPKIR